LVIPVQDEREGLSADHQGALGLAKPNKIIGDGQRIDEAGTDSLEIHREADCTQSCLDPGGSGGKRVVRSRRRHDQAVDVAALQAGMVERLVRRRQRQVGSQFAIRRDMTLTDARALADPFVGRVQPLRQFVIGDDATRQVGAGAQCDRSGDHDLPDLERRR
jgi:hypothetical protein